MVKHYWRCSFCGLSSENFVSRIQRDESHNAHLAECSAHFNAGLPAGGALVTANALHAATDDQLHAEWMRRHPNQALTAFGGVSDEQLRAECERRFAGPVNEYTRLSAEHHALEAERDEWKRRAEAAEAGFSVRRDARPRQNLVAQRLDVARQLVAELEANVQKAMATMVYGRDAAPNESGPGIKALPERREEPLACLDEDLLCEDA